MKTWVMSNYKAQRDIGLDIRVFIVNPDTLAHELADQEQLGGGRLGIVEIRPEPRTLLRGNLNDACLPSCAWYAVVHFGCS